MRAEVDFSELSSHRTVRAGLNERRLRPASPLRTPLRRLPRRERLIEPYLTRTGGFRGGVGAVKGMGGHVMVLVGLLGRPGAGACQNLPQRRPAAVSAANETAEYQRFSSRVPARWGVFVADLDNPRRRGPPEGVPRAGRRPRRAPRRANRAHRPRRRLPRMPPDAETCTSHSKVQLQPSFSRAKCTSRRGRGQPQPSRTTATTPRSTTTPASRPPLLVRKAHPAIPRARETGVSRSAPPRVLPHHCADPGQP